VPVDIIIETNGQCIGSFIVNTWLHYFHFTWKRSQRKYCQNRRYPNPSIFYNEFYTLVRHCCFY